jgi:hypothetical protein
MRGAAVAVFAFFAFSCFAATPTPGEEEHAMERVGLRSIAGWLKTHGAEGYLAADVAQALGIGRGEATLDARQRGFRSAGTLRVAQLLADDSVLFMVQAADGEVYFYHSTLRGGLRRALLSIPGRGAVLPLRGAQAEANFRSEVLYWEDKAAND